MYICGRWYAGLIDARVECDGDDDNNDVNQQFISVKCTGCQPSTRAFDPICAFICTRSSIGSRLLIQRSTRLQPNFPLRPMRNYSKTHEQQKKNVINAYYSKYV